jgi:hypothetical protein
LAKKVVAIVGSYRKGCTVDSLVDTVLSGAREKGAEVGKIYMLDQQVEFCTNCRTCTQEPGPRHGICIQKDDLESILSQVDAADALVLGAPVNCFNVNALTRRFMERLVAYAYWPWGKAAGPIPRNKTISKKAVLISTSAMPGLFIPWATGAPRALKATAKIFGARPIGTIWLGLSAIQPKQEMPAKALQKAKQLGFRLAT